MNSKIKDPLISVIIPVYNGSQTIEHLVDELIASFVGFYRLEAVLVNDCSPDESEKACIRLFEKYPDIVCFYSLSINVGEHNAAMAGLNQATGDFAVIIDDDFQNPVSEVIKLIKYMMQSQYDVVYTYYEEKKHSLLRNLGSRFNDKVANLMLKKPKHLYLSSFKIFNRFLIDEIIKYDLPYPYIDGMILRTTSNIGQLEVLHIARFNGKSNYTLRKLVVLWMNMFTNFSIYPLRIATLMGFLFSMIGFAIAIIILIDYFIDAKSPQGYTSVMVVLSFYAGIQLLAIGMVGEYLGRLFISHNKKPQFSIRKTFKKKVNEQK